MPPNTYHLEQGLTAKRAAELAQLKELRTLEFSTPVDERLFGVLEREIFRKRKDVRLRARGLRTRSSLSWLKRVPSLEILAIESRAELRDVETIVELGNLKQLHLSVSGLQSFEFLEEASRELRALRLGRTKSTRPRLDSIGGLGKLHTLSIEGHRKGVEVLTELTGLRQLKMSAVPLPDLELLVPLTRLWCLRLGHCGLVDLGALPHLERLRSVELTAIRRLADLSPLGRVKHLGALRLCSLSAVQKLPSFRRLRCLRRLELESMKRLGSLKPLAGASALESLTVIEPRLDPAAFRCLVRHPALQRLRVQYDSAGKTARLDKLLGCSAAYGVYRFER